MQASSWAALLRQIPPEQHDQLMVVTGSGVEIALNNILRVGAEFVAIKGRLAGSQDAGRVFFLPYSNIDYFGFQKEVKESEFEALFGTLLGPASGATPAAATAGAAEKPVESAAPVPATPPPPTLPGRAAAPIKSAVLEKFRSRLGSSSNGNAFRPPVDE